LIKIVRRSCAFVFVLRRVGPATRNPQPQPGFRQKKPEN
jgi:hypothetical protein